MAPRVLLLGGHGKVSLLLTPKLVARNWHLTSVIRNPDQKPDILAAAGDGPGKVDVLVESLEEVKSEADARRILENVKPDWVVWSAGAGGSGGPARTKAIDRDAAIHFIRSAVAMPRVSKILLVSALSIRRGRAAWHDDDDHALVQKMNNQVMPAYYEAKLAADEALTVLGDERVRRDGRDKFSYIILRPGRLTDDDESGLVTIGKPPARGQVSRADVADVAARLLETDGALGWFDILNGDRPVQEEITRVVRDGVDSMEGEDIAVMKSHM